MVAAAISKIGLMAICRSLWHIFARNFILSLKTIWHDPFCRQNSIPKKSKMAAAAIWIQFNGHNYPVIIAYIRTKFGTASKSDVSETGLPGTFSFHFWKNPTWQQAPFLKLAQRGSSL